MMNNKLSYLVLTIMGAFFCFIIVSPQTCVPGIKESPHFCRDSDYISDYCTLKFKIS